MPNEVRTTPTGVAHRISHDNLHIKCASFNQDQANTVMGLMQKFHSACRKIFIDVRDVQPKESVAANFKASLQKSTIAPSQIFFKGQSGFDLAINGNRILLQTAKQKKQDLPLKEAKHTCCGKCKHCHRHGDLG